MKNSILKVLIAMIAIFTTVQTAQLNAKDMKELRSELHNSINNYKTTNIIPQMNTWKSDIDRNIKSEDLTKLNVLREKAYNLKLQAKKNFESMKQEAAQPKNGERRRPENRDLNKKQTKEIGKELKAIINNNEDYFDKLFSDAKPVLRNWRDDIEDLIEKWHDDNEELIEEAMENQDGKFKPRQPKMDGMMGGKKFAAARILLYNGKSDDLEMDETFQKNGIEDLDDYGKAKNYPNPFNEQTNIKFNLPKSGNVKISIVDEYGKVIEEVQNSYLNKGEHSINYVPKSKLNNGLYFYRIESGDYKESGKLIYQK